MGTCAICLRQAPAGYNQCRDCIATFSVQENPIEFRRNLSIPAGGSYAAEKQAERETCPNCGCSIDEGERLAAEVTMLRADITLLDGDCVRRALATLQKQADEAQAEVKRQCHNRAIGERREAELTARVRELEAERLEMRRAVMSGVAALVRLTAPDGLHERWGEMVEREDVVRIAMRIKEATLKGDGQ